MSLRPRQNATSHCVPCPNSPLCNCAANQDCFLINRDCSTCGTFRCVAKDNSSTVSQSAGVSKGTLVGATVGAMVFLAIVLVFFLWYRRAMLSRKATAVVQTEGKTDIPAPAETVLNRPDPTEKLSPSPTDINTVRVYSSSSNTTIDLDPESQNFARRPSPYSPSQASTRNPFEDNSSIQTAGTESTNVIPIALVSPESHGSLSRSQSRTATTTPIRPPRNPGLNLNLEHVNVSRDSLPSTTQRSDGSSRLSYMSAASYSSDLLREAPVIITPTKSAVRQVVGVVKAEVINTPGPNSPNFSGLKPTMSSRPPVGSPLASTSFGPADVVKEIDGVQQANPFGDEHSATRGLTPSPSASVTTFGIASPVPPAPSPTPSDWVPNGPNLPWAHSGNRSRPSSVSTQAASIVDIGSATRVNVGLQGLTGGFAMSSSPLNAGDFPLSPYRNTMGKLISPTNGHLGTLQEQQQRALAHAQARAQAQGLDRSRRISGSSILSSTSTKADSILESFPFVPPSPISDRPIRTPPVSPLGQQSFSPTTPLSQPFSNKHSSKEDMSVGNVPDSPLPDPPNRRTLGLSTGSQISTASSGLGSFPFQIDPGNSSDNAPPPSVYNGNRKRASLDTLAITADLSSYPLGIDDSGDGITSPKKS